MSNQLEPVYGPISVMMVFDGNQQHKFELPDYIQTRKDLEQLLIEKGISYNKKDMRLMPGQIGLVDAESAVVRPDYVVKEYEGRERPVATMGLFLTPKKNDSGAIDVSKMGNLDVRTTVRDLSKKDEKAKIHFNSGKSWTNKSTDELRELLTKWYGGTTSTVVDENRFVNETEVKQPKKVTAPSVPSNELPKTEEELLTQIAEAIKDLDDVAAVTEATIASVVAITPESVVCRTKSYTERKDCLQVIKDIRGFIAMTYSQLGQDIADCKETRRKLEEEARKAAEAAAKAKSAEKPVEKPAVETTSAPSVDDDFADFAAKFARFRR